MALMAADDFQTAEFQRGIQYLVNSQLPDGSWKEDFFTGTGFPKVFYLKYHLYSIYFPLICLRELEQTSYVIARNEVTKQSH
jgi:squalene-hopene/tetraprenyl-beta-curcumene cyclase